MRHHEHGCGWIVYKAKTLSGKTIYLDPHEGKPGSGYWKFDVGTNRVIRTAAEGTYNEHPCPKKRNQVFL